MRVFVDTSALYALVAASDADHASVTATLARLREAKAELLTTNYVSLETLSLVQRRFGVGAARALHDDFMPLLKTVWVDASLHEHGLESLLAANRRDLSLVDCVSFSAMRRLGLRQVFTVDPHFKEQGFECLPE